MAEPTPRRNEPRLRPAPLLFEPRGGRRGPGALLRPGVDRRPARAAGPGHRADAGVPGRGRPGVGVPGDRRGAARRSAPLRPADAGRRSPSGPSGPRTTRRRWSSSAGTCCAERRRTGRVAGGGRRGCGAPRGRRLRGGGRGRIHTPVAYARRARYPLPPAPVPVFRNPPERTASPPVDRIRHEQHTEPGQQHRPAPRITVARAGGTPRRRHPRGRRLARLGRNVPAQHARALGGPARTPRSCCPAAPPSTSSAHPRSSAAGCSTGCGRRARAPGRWPCTAGRMLLFAAPGTAQRLPSLLRWEEWGADGAGGGRRGARGRGVGRCRECRRCCATARATR